MPVNNESQRALPWLHVDQPRRAGAELLLSRRPGWRSRRPTMRTSFRAAALAVDVLVDPRAARTPPARSPARMIPHQDRQVAARPRPWTLKVFGRSGTRRAARRCSWSRAPGARGIWRLVTYLLPPAKRRGVTRKFIVRVARSTRSSGNAVGMFEIGDGGADADLVDAVMRTMSPRPLRRPAGARGPRTSASWLTLAFHRRRVGALQHPSTSCAGLRPRAADRRAGSCRRQLEVVERADLPAAAARPVLGRAPARARGMASNSGLMSFLPVRWILRRPSRAGGA